MPARPVSPTASASPTLRFAPSPNGRLHLGHAYSALLNAGFAERLGARLLLRIEDIDPVRSRPELIEAIRDDLAWLGLRFDGAVRRQSEHLPFYARALDDLTARGLAYPCFCSRKAIAARVAALEEGGAVVRDPDGTPLYPGTCRALPPAMAEARRAAGEPHTWRLDMARALAAAPGPHSFRCFAVSGEAGTFLPLREEGTRASIVEHDGTAHPTRWGDAVIARRDVPTSYHLAVVLDDAAQAVTHVVRGQDLEAATDLHVLLQRLLDLSTPAYHHHGLIREGDGRKLAKSRGSESLADLRAQGVGASEVRAMLGF